MESSQPPITDTMVLRSRTFTDEGQEEVAIMNPLFSQLLRLVREHDSQGYVLVA